MSELTFKLEFVGTPCIDGLSEDAIRAIEEQFVVKIDSADLDGVVRAPKNTRTRVAYGQDGNFDGVTAKINGKIITLFPGVGGGQLAIYEGIPTSEYPGAGWEVVVEASMSMFSQTSDQSTWKYFVARRIGILNTISIP